MTDINLNKIHNLNVIYNQNTFNYNMAATNNKNEMFANAKKATKKKL